LGGDESTSCPVEWCKSDGIIVVFGG
jgi:hypothetical protein